MFAPVDVTDPRQVSHAIDATVEQLGSLDVLVNNAGVLDPRDGSVTRIDDRGDLGLDAASSRAPRAERRALRRTTSLLRRPPHRWTEGSSAMFREPVVSVRPRWGWSPPSERAPSQCARSEAPTRAHAGSPPTRAPDASRGAMRIRLSRSSTRLRVSGSASMRFRISSSRAWFEARVRPQRVPLRARSISEPYTDPVTTERRRTPGRSIGQLTQPDDPHRHHPNHRSASERSLSYPADLVEPLPERVPAWTNNRAAASFTLPSAFIVRRGGQVAALLLVVGEQLLQALLVGVTNRAALNRWKQVPLRAQLVERHDRAEAADGPPHQQRAPGLLERVGVVGCASRTSRPTEISRSGGSSPRSARPAVRGSTRRRAERARSACRAGRRATPPMTSAAAPIIRVRRRSRPGCRVTSVPTTTPWPVEVDPQPERAVEPQLALLAEHRPSNRSRTTLRTVSAPHQARVLHRQCRLRSDDRYQLAVLGAELPGLLLKAQDHADDAVGHAHRRDQRGPRVRRTSNAANALLSRASGPTGPWRRGASPRAVGQAATAGFPRRPENAPTTSRCPAASLRHRASGSHTVSDQATGGRREPVGHPPTRCARPRGSPRRANGAPAPAAPGARTAACSRYSRPRSAPTGCSPASGRRRRTRCGATVCIVITPRIRRRDDRDREVRPNRSSFNRDELEPRVGVRVLLDDPG